MKTLANQLASYSAYHRHPMNKVLHFLGVPMVTISLFIALGWFRFTPSDFPITGAWIFFLGVAIYYLRLDFQVGALTLLAFTPLLILSHYLSQPSWPMTLYWFLIFFVGGWIIQLLGHFIEGRRPALTDNLTQVFNAPLFLICEILFKFHQRMELKPKV